MNCIEVFSNDSHRRLIQRILFRGLSNGIISEIDQCVFENKNLLF